MKSGQPSFLMLVLLLISLFVAAGCGDTSTDSNTDDDDDDSEGDGDGDDDDDDNGGLKISDLQNPDSPNHPMVDTDVSLKGVVVTSPDFEVSSNLRGFFVSDIGGGEYSGILVVRYVSLEVEVAVGDKANLSGSYTEFCGVPDGETYEFCGSQVMLESIEFDGTADVPAPVAIDSAASIATLEDTDVATWEGHKWEGQVVELSNVTVTNEDAGFGMWTVDNSLNVSYQLYDYPAKLDEALPYLRGFLYVSYGQSKLLPRSAADIAGAAPACTDGQQRCQDNKIQTCNEAGTWVDGTDCTETNETCVMSSGTASCTDDASFTVYDMRNPDSENYLADGSPITLSGVVVTSEIVTVSANSNLDGFFIADVGGGAWHCTMAVFKNTELTVTVQAGDTIDLAGTVKHFCGNNSEDNQEYCMQQIQITSVTANASSDLPQPQAVADASSIATGGADAYMWQSCPVYVENVTVSEQLDYGQFRVTGNLMVDDMLYRYSLPDVGTKFSLLQGFLYTSYGDHKLLPRGENDLIVGCNAGQTRCWENQIQTCTDGDWANQTDCGDTQTCVEGNDGPSCVDNTSLSIYDIQKTDSPNYLADGTVVTLQNIVVTSDVVTVATSSNLDGFFVADQGGGAWHCAMAVYKNNVLTNVNVNPGDVVTLAGTVKHFCNTNATDQQQYCNHQIQITSVTATGAVEPPAAQLIADPSTVATGGAAADQWQGCRLRVEDVSVQSNNQGYGVFAIDGNLLVDTFFFYTTPEVGKAYDSVEGFLYTSYGDHKLAPTEEADFVAAGGGEDGDETDGDETDGDETDGDTTDGDETDGDETDGDETDGDTEEDLGVIPTPGDVIITEFIANPFGTDTTLEWIEIYNTTASTLNLSDLVLVDASNTTFEVADSTTLAAHSYGTFTASATAPTGVQNVLGNGIGIAQNNTGDSLILKLVDPIDPGFGTVVLDQIDYVSAWVTEGASTQLSADQFGNANRNQQSLWCAGQGNYGDGSNNLGTPGTANATCTAP